MVDNRRQQHTVSTESDVDRDDAQALTRVAGESDNDTYVGRGAGQDEGYADETGAERRAAR